jgi:hypothetical protein
MVDVRTAGVVIAKITGSAPLSGIVNAARESAQQLADVYGMGEGRM